MADGEEENAIEAFDQGEATTWHDRAEGGVVELDEEDCARELWPENQGSRRLRMWRSTASTTGRTAVGANIVCPEGAQGTNIDQDQNPRSQLSHSTTCL